MKLKNGFTVLVTGAGGFLGKELVKQLLEDKSINIVAITSNVERLTKDFGEVPNLNVLHTEHWVDRIENADILINCAFPRTSNPKLLAEGILFTENVIKNAVKINIKSIINISSQSVYSQKEKTTINESATVSPESLYGMTKYACERIVSMLCEINHINYSNIRLASLTGFDLEVRMTNRFVKAAINGETIKVHGGKQKISYLEVRDAAAAIVAMIKVDPVKWKNVYNLGNNNYFTILELVKYIKKIASEYSIENVNVEIKQGQDNFNNLIQSDVFYMDFMWEPFYDMPLMVEELFKYYSA